MPALQLVGCDIARLVLLALWVIAPALVQAADPVGVYRTEFEAAEGYVADAPLEGQDDWRGGGEEVFQNENGVISGVFDGRGQQAFIGGSLDALNANYYSVWRTISSNSIPANTRFLRFSVLFSIQDSTIQAWDNFYWSVYNPDGKLLFGLEFDNFDFGIYRWLENATSRVDTGVIYVPDELYRLQILMDFHRNQWHAHIGSTLLATNEPIRTTNTTTLALGDLEAGWNVYDLGNPGDNRMVFDEFELGAELLPDAPLIAAWNKNPPGNFSAQVTRVEPGQNYAVDASDDFTNWAAVSTHTGSPEGTFDFIDRTTSGVAHRFYRVRWIP